MNRSRFLTISSILAVLFLFLKIYQHNRIFQVIREKQSIEREMRKLTKEKNKKLVELYQMKDQELVRFRAENELGMVQLRPSQVVTVRRWNHSTTLLDSTEVCSLSHAASGTCACGVSPQACTQTFTIRS